MANMTEDKVVTDREKVVLERAGEVRSPGAMPSLRVVLVDDCADTRARAAELLSELNEVEVVGQAAEASGGLALIKKHRPDLLILDIDMPGITGLVMLEE